MATDQSTRTLKAEIAALYGQRSALMAGLQARLAHARGWSDVDALDIKTREHLTFEIVQLIANWDGAKVVDSEVTTDDEVVPILAAIVELEEAISTLEDALPEH